MASATSRTQRQLLGLCATQAPNSGEAWSFIAREAQRAGNIREMLAGRVEERSKDADAFLNSINRPLSLETPFDRVGYEISEAMRFDARLVTVLDDDYPANLRSIPNLPPFLFVKGEIRAADAFAVAVVGTRNASVLGLQRAQRMASLLAERGVTVVSGLARGIDTQAHQAALRAGGRTIAVLGTGIAAKCYPPENSDLLAEIAQRGAVVSQFWPTATPAKDSFPLRNVVSSGIAQGTVVIEASATSGAKMQARIASEHGKKVFVLRSLVESEDWARKYVHDRKAIEVREIEDVMSALASNPVR